MTDTIPETEDLSAILLEQTERLLSQHADKEALAGADRGEWQAGLWAAMEAAGLPLALLAEDKGGVGLSPADAFSVIRLAARHAAPVPLGETMIAAALWGEAPEGPATLAAEPGGARALSRLPFGRNAGHVLVHEGGPRVALVSLAGARFAEGKNLAGEPRDGVEIAAPAEIREVSWLGEDGLLPVGALLRAQQMAGALERALEMALQHAMEREQFGRPIAKFQAVQQMLADAAGQVAAASAIADLAAEAWGEDDLAFVAGMAKARAGEAAGKVGEIVHQVHAAMGFTQEHPLHFLTRRLWSWREEFGADPFWEERVGRLVCAEGGEALWPRLVAATGRQSSGGRKAGGRKAGGEAAA